MTEARLQALLGERLTDLCLWLSSALEIGEMRSVETVRQAKEAFLKWLSNGWDDDSGDIAGALAWALVSYVESGQKWTDDLSSLEADLSVSADPAWKLPEFHLLVASLLADQALLAFKQGTKKQMFLSALLYADAIECREYWDKTRGPAGARNPNTRLGKIHAVVRGLDERIAGRKALKQQARMGVRARLLKDPKQAAKAEAFRMWQEWQAGKAIHGSGAAFARRVVDLTAIEDPNTVQRWMRQWRKCIGATGSA